MKTYDEMMTEFKTLMRCQLYALPNGKEMYERILPQMRHELKNKNELEEQLEMSLTGRLSTIDCWCNWSDTIEGFNFWDVVDKDLLWKINKKGTPWLISPFPTFIEVDI